MKQPLIKYDEFQEQKEDALYMINVICAIPIKNYRLKIRLSNGRQGVFDVTPYLDKDVFREL
jgi:Protein of unknown function (DUF2442)